MSQAAFVSPMLARLVTEPPEGEGWVYERKLDGLRCIAVRAGARIELWSRSKQSFSGRFGGIVAAMAELPIDDVVLDGEIVALEGDRTSFALLQRPGSKAKPLLYVFDVLRLAGEDLTGRPLLERKEALAKVAGKRGVMRRVDHVEGDPVALLAEACAAGWEGLIAKRATGPYRSGRSADWLKLKCSASQELVIGGWTEPRGARSHFGALLVGYYDTEGFLRYAGKVGTGFGAPHQPDGSARSSRRRGWTRTQASDRRLEVWIRGSGSTDLDAAGQRICRQEDDELRNPAGVRHPGHRRGVAPDRTGHGGLPPPAVSPPTGSTMTGCRRA